MPPSAWLTWLARATAPIAFATRRRVARQLFSFALAEHESMLELRAAAGACPSPDRRALYLRHALDEARHATVFTRASAEIRRSIGLSPFGEPHSDCERLYERLGEAHFLAFVHRGERRGRVQFEVYRDYFARRKDERLAAVFAALIADERRHETYTLDLLRSLTKEERIARRHLRRLALWEAARAWRRSGQALSRVVYTAAMIVVYASLLPFALLVRLIRPARAGWH